MKKIALFALLALAAPMFGQGAKELLAKHWAVSRDFTIAVAEAMPADGYASHPNQEEMTFAQLMMHIATANSSTFAMVSGEKAPAVPEKLAAWRKDASQLDKASVVKFLTDSFDFCVKTMNSTPADKFEAMVGPEGRQVMGYERVWGMFTHTAHHRGQAEVYLRVKGITPPAYKF